MHVMLKTSLLQSSNHSSRKTVAVSNVISVNVKTFSVISQTSVISKYELFIISNPNYTVKTNVLINLVWTHSRMLLKMW